MTVLSSTLKILEKAGKPLHVKEITRRLIADGLWKTSGKTPERTVSARITEDIRKNGKKSPLERVGPGLYALKTSSRQKKASVQNLEILEIQAVELPVTGEGYTPVACAQMVLDKYGQMEPMHYREITQKAIEEGWLITRGKTPERSMNARIFTDIRRQERRGEVPRFIAHGGGYVSLSKWERAGLHRQIQQNNKQLQEALRKQLLGMTPEDFEELIYDLFDAMDFEMGARPKHKKDGGIDVRGTLIVDDVVHVEMAIQVKKWKPTRKVQAPIVRNVRGSLDAHERGMIITTSDFSSGAKKEAVEPAKTPIGLMNGYRLALLLTKYGFGTVNRAVDFLEKDESSSIWRL